MLVLVLVQVTAAIANDSASEHPDAQPVAMPHRWIEGNLSQQTPCIQCHKEVKTLLSFYDCGSC